MVRSSRWSTAATTSPTAIRVSDNPEADPERPEPVPAFLTAVATRALIFIEGGQPQDRPDCVVPVGMAEVSSCEVTVQPGQRIAKGSSSACSTSAAPPTACCSAPGSSWRSTSTASSRAGGDQPEDQHGAGAGRITLPPIGNEAAFGRPCCIPGLLPGEADPGRHLLSVGRALPRSCAMMSLASGYPRLKRLSSLQHHLQLGGSGQAPAPDRGGSGFCRPATGCASSALLPIWPQARLRVSRGDLLHVSGSADRNSPGLLLDRRR